MTTCITAPRSATRYIKCICSHPIDKDGYIVHRRGHPNTILHQGRTDPNESDRYGQFIYITDPYRISLMFSEVNYFTIITYFHFYTWLRFHFLAESNLQSQYPHHGVPSTAVCCSGWDLQDAARDVRRYIEVKPKLRFNAKLQHHNQTVFFYFLEFDIALIIQRIALDWGCPEFYTQWVAAP